MDWKIALQVIPIIVVLVILYSRHKKGEDIFKNILPKIFTVVLI